MIYTQNETANERFLELDALRGIAIILILFYHYTERYNQIYGHTEMLFAFRYGLQMVYLFFMLSGFVIFMSLESTKNANIFIFNRISRLYPVYWAAILITFTSVYIFTLPRKQVSLLDAIVNFTMLQELFNVKSVDGAYWPLSRFLSFYMIAFFISKLNLKKNMYHVCFIWVLLICLTHVLESKGFYLPKAVKMMILLDYGCFFILGIMFFFIKQEKSTLHLYNTSIVICCLASIYYIYGKLDFLAALIFSVIFMVIIYKRLDFLTTKPFLFLGSISYSLYLTHQNIGYIIIRGLYKVSSNYFIIIAVPTLFSLTLAAVLTFYVEVPASRYLRRIFNLKND